MGKYVAISYVSAKKMTIKYFRECYDESFAIYDNQHLVGYAVTYNNGETLWQTKKAFEEAYQKIGEPNLYECKVFASAEKMTAEDFAKHYPKKVSPYLRESGDGYCVTYDDGDILWFEQQEFESGYELCS